MEKCFPLLSVKLSGEPRRRVQGPSPHLTASGRVPCSVLCARGSTLEPGFHESEKSAGQWQHDQKLRGPGFALMTAKHDFPSPPTPSPPQKLLHRGQWYNTPRRARTRCSVWRLLSRWAQHPEEVTSEQSSHKSVLPRSKGRTIY